jgi:LmbE family N-acetylglucosaminyl deacetylase
MSQNKPETIFVVMDATYGYIHAAHREEAEAKKSVVAFANATGFPQVYEEYSIGSPLAWALVALDYAKDRINGIMDRRKAMNTHAPGVEKIHLEGMGQAWGLVHELRDELIDKKLSLPNPRKTELKEAADAMNVDLGWLEGQCGSHLTVRSKDLLRLLKAVKAYK